MVKREYHTDVGTVLDYNEFHSETLHDVPHGNSFPASPSARDRFFRDDLNTEYIYSGTEWVPVIYHTYEHTIGGKDPLTITNQIRFRLDNRVTEPTPYVGKIGAPYFRTDMGRARVVVSDTLAKSFAFTDDITGAGEPHHLESYLIYKDGATFKARNGDTGVIDHSGSQVHSVINDAIGTGNCLVYLKLLSDEYLNGSISMKTQSALIGMAPSKRNHIVKLIKNFNGNMITDGGQNDVCVKNLYLDGVKGTYTGDGINFTGGAVWIENLRIDSVYGTSVSCDVGAYQLGTIHHIWVANGEKGFKIGGYDGEVHSCVTTNMDDLEWHFVEYSTDHSISDLYVGGGAGADNCKMLFEGARGLLLNNIRLDYGPKHGIRFKNGSSWACQCNHFTNLTITQCGLDASNTYSGVRLEGNTIETQIIGGYIGRKKSGSDIDRLKYAVEELSSADYNLVVGMDGHNIAGTKSFQMIGSNSKAPSASNIGKF